GKPASKPKGQRLWIRRLLRFRNLGDAGATESELQGQPPPRKPHKAVSPSCVPAPQLVGWDLRASPPHARVARQLCPSRAEIAVVDVAHLVRDPRLRVDAVGHMSDGDLVRGNSRPQVPPHRARDAGMETTDPVDHAGGANG